MADQNRLDDEEPKKAGWRESALTLGDKVRFAGVCLTAFVFLSGILGTVLLFWKDTSVRLSVLETRVNTLEQPKAQPIPEKAVAKK